MTPFVCESLSDAASAGCHGNRLALPADSWIIYKGKGVEKMVAWKVRCDTTWRHAEHLSTADAWIIKLHTGKIGGAKRSRRANFSQRDSGFVARCNYLDGRALQLGAWPDLRFIVRWSTSCVGDAWRNFTMKSQGNLLVLVTHLTHYRPAMRSGKNLV